MYRVHGIAELDRKTRSGEGLNGRRLRVIITENKRYTQQEIADLTSFVNSSRGVTPLTLVPEDTDSAPACKAAVNLLLRRPDFDAYYLRWGDYFPLSRQLRVIRDADIHVTSTGTAAYFSLFLPDGAVHINLGDKVRAKHCSTCGEFPSWGEEYLLSANSRIKAIYRNVSSLMSGILSAQDIVDLVDAAVLEIRKGFRIPSVPETNLSPVGRVAYELARLDAGSFRAMRGYNGPNSGLQCHHSGFAPQMDPAPLVFGYKTSKECPGVNESLLSELRHSFLGPDFDQFIQPSVSSYWKPWQR
jgi:hypothetical protein